jgi:hypothetical protein
MVTTAFTGRLFASVRWTVMVLLNKIDPLPHDAFQDIPLHLFIL